MLKFARIVVFTFLTAMAVTLLSDKADAMGFFEEGSGQKTFPGSRKINPSTVPKQQAPKKVVKTPARNSGKSKKAATKTKAKYKEFDCNKAMDCMIKGAITGGLSSKIKDKLEKEPAVKKPKIKPKNGKTALIGAALGGVGYTIDWSLDNKQFFAEKAVDGVTSVAEGYKKISHLEDPMGKSWP